MRATQRPRILVTGVGGQVGGELATLLPAHGDVVAVDRAALDLADADALVRIVREVAPDLVVNAAAYTAVDRAEGERDAAFAVNARAPAILAEEVRRLDAILIHYSTDYVFDGRASMPYTEEDATAPLNVYGASKLEGEVAIAASGAHAIVLRTSWVYGLTGHNFLPILAAQVHFFHGLALGVARGICPAPPGCGYRKRRQHPPP